ncbi:hypothetical protein EUX98_g8746 [Antrodiella citrinella]|uniref:Uncharacterized protein n=1 Tax=Antrodiella citrinella TaxID=2447956 RepID=A0A4S4M4P1_9APHY|nr:hypothetical protein EUX98_g8746 [Antrodiella citrinella]
MVNTRIYTRPDGNAQNVYINGRLYAAEQPRPRNVGVPTRCTPSLRYPCPESVLDGSRLQPYVHDCTARVKDGRHVYDFVVFFKNHRYLPLSTSLRSLTNAAVRGDIVIMRLGTHGRVVNLRQRDSALADFVITRFLEAAPIKQHLRTKRTLCFERMPVRRSRRKNTQYE